MLKGLVIGFRLLRIKNILGTYALGYRILLLGILNVDITFWKDEMGDYDNQCYLVKCFMEN